MPFAHVIYSQENEGLNLTVTPVLIDLVAEPGKKLSEKLRVKNNMNQEINVVVKVNKLEPRGEQGDAVPTEPDGTEDYLNWMTFDKSSYTISPREWADIRFVIEIPEDAAFGYYYALRLTSSTGVESETQNSIQGEIIVPVLLKIDNDGAKAEANLVEFKATKNINEYMPVDFLTRISNTGNIHIKPRGNIFIKGNNGKEIDNIEVNQGGGNILPNSIREFDASWSDGFIVREEVTENGAVVLDQNGRKVTRLKFQWNKLTDFRFGKYTASLLMAYDDGQKDIPIVATTTFWIIPYKFLSILFISVILLVFIIRLLLKAYVRNQIKKYQTSRTS